MTFREDSSEGVEPWVGILRPQNEWPRTWPVAPGSATLSMETIRKAMEDITVASHQPDIMILHPRDWEFWDLWRRTHRIFDGIDWDGWMFPRWTRLQRRIRRRLNRWKWAWQDRRDR